MMNEADIYHAGMRELQDARDTRGIADRLAHVTLRRPGFQNRGLRRTGRAVNLHFRR
jgi:hypothetical protein